MENNNKKIFFVIKSLTLKGGGAERVFVNIFSIPTTSLDIEGQRRCDELLSKNTQQSKFIISEERKPTGTRKLISGPTFLSLNTIDLLKLLIPPYLF